MNVLNQVLANGTIKPDDRVMVCNTDGALNYPETIKKPTCGLNLGQPLEWETIAKD